MSDDQVIYPGATEYTYPRTITETTGKDISGDTVMVSLGTYSDPLTWVTPDVVEHPTPSSVVVQLLLTAPPATEAAYWLWVKVTDSPEVVPRRTPGRITFAS